MRRPTLYWEALEWGSETPPAARPSSSGPSSRSSRGPSRRSSRACRPGPWRRPRPPRPSRCRHRRRPRAGRDRARRALGAAGRSAARIRASRARVLSAARSTSAFLAARRSTSAAWAFSAATRLRVALVEGLAGHPELVHQVAVVGGQQVEDLDAGDGGGRVVGAEHGGHGAAGALDVGGGRPGAEDRPELAQVLLGRVGLGAQALEGPLDPPQGLVALVVLLDQLIGLPVQRSS